MIERNIATLANNFFYMILAEINSCTIHIKITKTAI
jgi:hypothetical protein